MMKFWLFMFLHSNIFFVLPTITCRLSSTVFRSNILTIFWKLSKILWISLETEHCVCHDFDNILKITKNTVDITTTYFLISAHRLFSCQSVHSVAANRLSKTLIFKVLLEYLPDNFSKMCQKFDFQSTFRVFTRQCSRPI